MNMDKSTLKQLIEEAAKREGIDLIGFAGKDRFASIAPEHNPFAIFPEGKTEAGCALAHGHVTDANSFHTDALLKNTKIPEVV